MLDAIQGLPCFPGDGSQANPNKHGASDVIALNPRLSALATLDPCELFSLSMKLLHLPAQGSRLLCAPRDILSQVVRHDRGSPCDGGTPPHGTVLPCALWETP